MLEKYRHRHFIDQVKYSTSTLPSGNNRKTLSLTKIIRYFVTEVLETIAPPYSQEFVSLFLPLVENEEITGTMDKVIVYSKLQCHAVFKCCARIKYVFLRV